MTRFLAPVRSVRPRLQCWIRGDHLVLTPCEDLDSANVTGQWLKGRAVEVEV